MLPYQVSKKVIISGQYLEFYEYEVPYWVGFPRLQSKYGKILRYKNQDEIRADNSRRARSKLRRLINSNSQLSRFITLTFNIEAYDLNFANAYFQNFIKRLRRLYVFDYICVPEFQSVSGRVHYHMLSNIDFLTENEEAQKQILEPIWNKGFVFVRNIENIDNVGAYIAKYLGKQSFDKRYFKKRKFFYSRDLKKPVIVYNYEQVINIEKNYIDAIPNLIEILCEFRILTSKLGMLEYKQNRLNNILKVVV